MKRGSKIIKYTNDESTTEEIKDIISTLELNYIVPERVRVIRSYGAKTRALARIWTVPKTIIKAYNIPPVYVIELVYPRFEQLDKNEKIKVLIHELLHIPSNFSGGLRPHGKKVNRKTVEKLYSEYVKRKSQTSI
ncbi:hypothetical protein HS7_18540 [Sulfolobales archaeon HS-7]|nr:hypothetical protein HS7_18540 [Sulfolobales archaeon HS-7]